MPSDSRKQTLSIEVDRDTRIALMEIARARGGLNPLELAAELLRDRVRDDARAIQPTRH